MYETSFVLINYTKHTKSNELRQQQQQHLRYNCAIQHWMDYPYIVPPRWIVEPSDVNVERNRQITLHCQAQGVPTPVIVWKKTTGNN